MYISRSFILSFLSFFLSFFLYSCRIPDFRDFDLDCCEVVIFVLVRRGEKRREEHSISFYFIVFYIMFLHQWLSIAQFESRAEGLEERGSWRARCSTATCFPAPRRQSLSAGNRRCAARGLKRQQPSQRGGRSNKYVRGIFLRPGPLAS